MPTFDLIIRGGQVVTPDRVERLDVAVEDGVIVELAPEVPGDAREVVDAAGLHVFPGLIDAHVHFNEPGRTDWEGFDTGSAALAAGGGTCFFDMPLNASPPTLDGPSFDLKLAAAKANSRTDFALWGGLTPGNLDRMEELADRGVVGFKAFMSNSGIDDFAAADDYTLYKGMQTAARLGLVVAVHAENDAITSGLAAAARAVGRTGPCDYLASRPVVAEVEAIQRVVAIAFDTGCRLHVVHVSSPEGAAIALGARVRPLGDGKFETMDVSFEICPHYLTFTGDDLATLGVAAKCALPLRDRAAVKELWEFVDPGGVDFVASDHSPSPAHMKVGDDFFAAWGGVAGVQSTLAVLTSREPALPLDLIAWLTGSSVTDRFTILNKGSIEKGNHADLSLIDLAATYTLTRDMLLDRHKLSPYVGRSFRGLVKRTFVRGHTVFKDGKAAADFRGRLVVPDRAGGGRG